ncbi:unnamed protein product [Rotaria magnacalcarata]
MNELCQTTVSKFIWPGRPAYWHLWYATALASSSVPHVSLYELLVILVDQRNLYCNENLNVLKCNNLPMNIHR